MALTYKELLPINKRKTNIHFSKVDKRDEEEMPI